MNRDVIILLLESNWSGNVHHSYYSTEMSQIYCRYNTKKNKTKNTTLSKSIENSWKGSKSRPLTHKYITVHIPDLVQALQWKSKQVLWTQIYHNEPKDYCLTLYEAKSHIKLSNTLHTNESTNAYHIYRCSLRKYNDECISHIISLFSKRI